jgi:hypothetical protein
MDFSREQTKPRFFYKYRPLPNVIVENDSLQILLLKLAWRIEEIATLSYSTTCVGGKSFSQSLWREVGVRQRPWRKGFA